MSTSLSAVIITFNEGHHLEQCLRAVSQVTDDIVVVDSFSTDNTVQVAKDCGAKVFQQSWKGYSQQKNDGNALAQYDWILSIDADEVLDYALIEAILNWKKNTPQPAAFKRMTNYCGNFIRHGGWYPDIKIRLFNKKLNQWEGTIHENLSNINKEDVFITRIIPLNSIMLKQINSLLFKPKTFLIKEKNLHCSNAYLAQWLNFVQTIFLDLDSSMVNLDSLLQEFQHTPHT